MSLLNNFSASVYAFYPKNPEPDSPRVVESAAKIVEVGLGLEVWLSDYDFTPYTPDDIKRLREICSNAVITTAHTNTFTWDHQKLVAEIPFARSLGARVLVVHPATVGFEKCDNPPSAQVLKDICKYALDSGIKLAFENSGRTGVAMLERALDIVGSEPDSTGLGICIDTGHANRSVAVDGVTVEDYLQKFSDIILELHLNDNFGAADLHLPPGKGSINWPAVITEMNKLPENTVMCLELSKSDDSKNPVDVLLESRRLLREALGGDHSLYLPNY